MLLEKLVCNHPRCILYHLIYPPAKKSRHQNTSKRQMLWNKVLQPTLHLRDDVMKQKDIHKIIASDEFGILTVVCSSKPGRKKKPKKHDHDAKQPREEKHELTCNAGGIHSAQPHSWQFCPYTCLLGHHCSIRPEDMCLETCKHGGWMHYGDHVSMWRSLLTKSSWRANK